MGKKNKVKVPRTVPGDFVSIKHNDVGMNVKFIRYADRVILCKMHVRNKYKGRSYFSALNIDNSFETKALCHPGNDTMPADKFVEETGMKIAFKRTKAGIRQIKRDLMETLKYHEQAAQDTRKTIDDLIRASDMINTEVEKYMSSGLLICSQRQKES